jgi:peptidoglycan/LPS O-acetylase OafA/YrhL
MLDVAWSLGVEIAFYLALAIGGPLLCRLCMSLKTERARAIMLVGALVVVWCASVAYKWWELHAADAAAEQPHIYLGPFAQLDTFAAGMLVAVIHSLTARRARPSERTRTLLLGGGAALLCLAILLRPLGLVPWVYFGTVTGIAFALILGSVILRPPQPAVTRASARSPFQYIGLVSYSLYLWHRPLLNALFPRGLDSTPLLLPLEIVGIVVVALAVAGASYWCIERPALQSRRVQPIRSAEFSIIAPDTAGFD